MATQVVGPLKLQELFSKNQEQGSSLLDEIEPLNWTFSSSHSAQIKGSLFLMPVWYEKSSNFF